MWVNSRCAIAAWLECFQEKPRTVSEWTGLPGEESVKRFEWSNGLDSALYKTIPFFSLKIAIRSHCPSILLAFSNSRKSYVADPATYLYPFFCKPNSSRHPLEFRPIAFPFLIIFCANATSSRFFSWRDLTYLIILMGEKNTCYQTLVH